ncbi:hypothetical protein HYZ99_02115 [Candidatus Peregrinibacteria bacterium]|nr:hypothetical protein [Candidatus Peregrinibacteria bacterium]
MREDLSPDWLSTGDEQRASSPAHEQHAPAKTAVKIRVGSQRVSRMPAAIIGIVLTVAVGVSALGATDSLMGQIPGIPAKAIETAIEIRITEDGIVPRTLDAAPGQTIVWINEQEIPHILESETLLGENGSFLYTPAIFPGSEEEFTISDVQEPGRHSYLSTTSVDVYGEINVIAEGRRGSAPLALDDKPESFEEFENEEFADEEFIQEESEAEEVLLAPDDQEETIDSSDPLAPIGALSDAEDETAVDQEGILPYNPYKVGSDTEHPFNEAGEPLHGGAPLISRPGFKPYRTTDAGPALWIVSILSIGMLAWVTRRSFQRIK